MVYAVRRFTFRSAAASFTFLPASSIVTPASSKVTPTSFIIVVARNTFTPTNSNVAPTSSKVTPRSSKKNVAVFIVTPRSFINRETCFTFSPYFVETVQKQCKCIGNLLINSNKYSHVLVDD